MKKKNLNKLIEIPNERIINRIFLMRGRKVMIDRDLAELYEVEIRVLVQAVKRNIERFPSDFMFQLTKEEYKNLRSQIETSSLRSQIVILKTGRGQHRKYLPYIFTEQGVAMLSSVLNSKKAIQVNIQIIRTFTKLRELLATNKEIRLKIESMEKKYDKKLQEVFEILKRLLVQKKKPKEPMGFVK